MSSVPLKRVQATIASPRSSTATRGNGVLPRRRELHGSRGDPVRHGGGFHDVVRLFQAGVPHDGRFAGGVLSHRGGASFGFADDRREIERGREAPRRRACGDLRGEVAADEAHPRCGHVPVRPHRRVRDVGAAFQRAHRAPRWGRTGGDGCSERQRGADRRDHSDSSAHRAPLSSVPQARGRGPRPSPVSARAPQS